MMDKADSLVGGRRLLMDLAEGRLAEDEVAAVELLLRAEPLVEPPPWVRRRAERIAGQRLLIRRERGQPLQRAAQRLVATLAFDSRVQPQFVGLRAADTRVRRLLFQAEGVEVDLEMTPRPGEDSIRLAGQITTRGSSPAGGTLRLSGVEGDWSVVLDEAGEFWLDRLPPGAYRLEIVLPERIVEVPVLPI